MKTKILLCILGASLFCTFGIPKSFAARLPVTEIPRLTIQISIPIAEGALTKANIDKTKYYITSVTYNNASGDWYWDFTFRPYDPYDRQLIHVRVYMNSSTEIK